LKEKIYLYDMKKILVAFICVYMLSSCSVFRKSEKYGCPSNGRNVGAEKIAAGDEKAVKASNKAKYKGRKSF
jgi:uncharacterized lipoprotein YehR (DUF1307 family)